MGAFEEVMLRVAVAAGLAFLLCACAGGPSRIEAPKPDGLVWYHDPSDRSAAIAVDWSGRQVDRLTLPVTSDGGRPMWTQSPDGRSLLLWNGTIVSRAGKTAGHVPQASTWADDSRHLCSIRNGSGGDVQMHSTQTGPRSVSSTYDPAFLFVYGVDGSRRKLAPTPGPNPHGDTWAICDFADDRAVILTSFTVSTLIAKETRLSTGAEILPPPGPPITPNLYTNGRLVVSSSPDLKTNSIRRVADGVEVGRLGLGQVVALSGDGHIAAMAVPGGSWPGNMSPSPTVEVVDTTTGHVVWSLPGSLDWAVPQPGGETMALSVGQSPDRFGDLWLVRRNGQATRLASRVPTGAYLND